MSEVRDQRSAVSGQMSEIRVQRSAVRDQRSGFVLSCSEWFGIFDHTADHFTDFFTEGSELWMLLYVYILTVLGEIEGRIGLAIFTVTICQFADKMRLISSLRPCFSQIQTDRTRWTADLACECIFFRRWERLADVVNRHRQLIRFFVNNQVLGRLNLHFTLYVSEEYRYNLPIGKRGRLCFYNFLQLPDVRGQMSEVR